MPGEEEGHRGAKSNDVMEGDSQHPLHTAMGAGGTIRRRGSRKEAETTEGQENAARWHVTSCCCRVRTLLIEKNTVRWSGDVEAEVLETASDGTGCSSNRADNARERKVIARAANAADGARHILYNPDRVKIQESAEYDGR